MAKFLKVILFLVLATAFCGSVSDAFTVQTVDEMVIAAQVSLGEEGDTQRNDVRQGSYIPAPKLPYLSDAEFFVLQEELYQKALKKNKEEAN